MGGADRVMTNLSSGLIGLSLLSGGGSLLRYTGGAAAESRAVRQARALFTLPASIPPWQQAAPTGSATAQVAAIKRMRSVVDAGVVAGGVVAGARIDPDALPDDVQTAFTAYKALDRLRLVAEFAARTGTTAAERASFRDSFANGLADLKSFLASAPSDQLHLAFAQPTRRAESVPMTNEAARFATVISGRGVAAARDEALSALTGAEQFRVTLRQGTVADTVTVDLGGGTAPPTLDSVAAAINAAVAAIPARNPDDTIRVDAGGNSVPRWNVRFGPDKADGKWGLSVRRSGTESVSIDQVAAPAALVLATGAAGVDGPTTTRIMRIDDPAGAMQRRTLGALSAVDRTGSERTRLDAEARLATAAALPAGPLRSLLEAGEAEAEAETETVFASTRAAAIATDGAGFSYVVGTASGDVGSNLSDGGEDLLLSRLDSEGRIVWQRTLGVAGEAAGAAVSIAPSGDIVVAATVSGGFDGTDSDGDLLVTTFDTAGEETFATLVRGSGADTASALAVAADGHIFVGGTSSRGGGDAFVARLDRYGRIEERRTIDSGGADRLTALAIDGSGELLALTGEGTEARLRRLAAQSLATDLATLDLGQADARTLAVAADGRIAVGGATLMPLAGVQANAASGGRDGFVAQVDADLGGARVTYVGTGAEDQVDSLAFLGGALYAGGRTTGALVGTRTGRVDGFVSRIDPATGSIATSHQFGRVGERTEPVRLSAVEGGGTVLGALGLHRGTLTPEDSPGLPAQTGLRAGDTFSIRVDRGTIRPVVIGEKDTLATLASRIRRIVGSRGTVGTPRKDGGAMLRIEARPGSIIQLIPGGEGRDALAKLGLPAAKLVSATPVDDGAPRVRPGGSYGLGLTEALDIGTRQGAALALARLKQAISISQTSYRSLYWDDTKAALADGDAGGSGSTRREQALLAGYQAALERLSGPASTLVGF